MRERDSRLLLGFALGAGALLHLHAAAAQRCPEGEVASLGHCCAAGQLWDRRYGRCVADPRAECAAGELAQCVTVGDHLADPRSDNADVRQATVYYRKACAGGQLAGCSALGDLALRGRGRPRNPDAARGLFQRACDGGHAAGCTGLGELALSSAPGDRRAASEAAALFETACERGDARGCALGALLVAGDADASEQARVQAETRAKGACDAGDALGCSVLARLHAAAAPGIGLEEIERAHQAACDAGESIGCAHLGFLQSRADASERQLSQARGSLSRACDGGHAEACARLGELFEQGRGGPQDASAARRHYREACELRDQTSCLRFARLAVDGTLEGRDAPEVRHTFEQACRMGSEAMCLELARRLLTGEGVARDPARASELLSAACKRGDGAACYEAAELAGYRAVAAARREADDASVQRALRAAAELHARACELGSAAGCTRLGLLQMNGQGTARHFEGAAAAFARACEAGDAAGCLYLARQTELGHGVERDAALAVERLERACAMGAMPACTQAAPGSVIYPAPYAEGATVPRRYASAPAASAPAAPARAADREPPPPATTEPPAGDSPAPGALAREQAADLGMHTALRLSHGGGQAAYVTRAILHQRVAIPALALDLELPLLFASDRVEDLSGRELERSAARVGNVYLGGRHAIGAAVLRFGASLPTAVTAGGDADEVVVSYAFDRRAYLLAASLAGLRDYWLWAYDAGGAVIGASGELRVGWLRLEAGADLALLGPVRTRANAELVAQAHLQGAVEDGPFVGALRLSAAGLTDDESASLALEPWLGYRLDSHSTAFTRVTLNLASSDLAFEVEPPSLALHFGIELR